MLVTMFTDASHIPQTNSAAWAVWAKSERGTLFHAGKFKGECLNSNEAEFKAIVNGVYLLSTSDICHRGDSILVQADNLCALSCVLPPRKISMCPSTRRAASMLDDLREKYELMLTTRHVKAHSGTGQPRLWVHDKCDRNARRLARQLHRSRTC